ncbi:MAG: HNH endonuclease [Planctomycetaceae bacterium]|nr:HNH endonuclease [Planctomycetaceae bacterium]
MAHPKHADVRARYDCCCGYCGVCEDDAGGELTVDHFIPVAAGGGDDDENLVYACFRCNLFKADFCPSDADRQNGHMLLHPLRDDLSMHLQLEEETGRLVALTDTGSFQIRLLRLNRQSLVAMRLRKQFRSLLAARQTLLESEVRELRAIVGAQGRYIEHLESLVERDPPLGTTSD